MMNNKTEIKRRSVAFNIADPFQNKLWLHSKQFTNFSSYIKTLIQRDMEGGSPQQKAPVGIKVDKALINGLI